MKNVTKLACWPELAALGFEPVKFRAHGKVVCIGARLLTKGGEICIEPGFYSERPYHITGPVNTPYMATLYRYEFGRRHEGCERIERINRHFEAREILPTVRLMVK
jgi:hypothetical protein